MPAAASARLTLALASLPLLAPVVHAQEVVPAPRAFRDARKLYYTPSDQGLTGFQCNVSFDWKAFLEKANNTTVSSIDQRLLYLQSIKLSVTDDLHSGGRLDWAAASPAPDDSEQSIAQLRTGFQALWTGFFETWNGFYTGDLLAPDEHSVVERTSSGYHVYAHEPSKTADELFSPDSILQSLHVRTPAYDSTLQPTFDTTPQGRLVSSFNSTISQPPTSPASTVRMTLHYAPVSGFQLPSELLIDVAGTASFDFHLTSCTVRTNTPTPAAFTPPSPR